MTGALDGIVVADFSRVLAGPYATMLMGDMGADVIKIERPGSGDDTRAWGPPYLDDSSNGNSSDDDSSGGDARRPMSSYFASVNRNKRSMTIDLTDPAGRDRALDLVREADVVVENFRAGTMERLGLGYADLRAHNPEVIYCAITGFGRLDGADLPGYDLLIQAMTGLMSITGPDGAPTKVGVAMVDVLTGLHAAIGILAALRHRDRTGHGQRVDLDLFSVALASMSNQTAAYVHSGVVPSAMGNSHPSIAPYEVIATADRPIALAVGNDAQFGRLCGVLGIGRLVDDPRYATNSGRVAHRETLIADLTSALTQRTADEWFRTLTDAGVPAGPINDFAESFTFARSIGIEPTALVDGSSFPVVANPIQMSVTPVSYRLAPPTLSDP